LLDLKYSYGRLLLEEVGKIPDAQQQIQALGLEPQQTKFYLDKLSTSKRALNGNEQSLKDTILKDLSCHIHQMVLSSDAQILVFLQPIRSLEKLFLAMRLLGQLQYRWSLKQSALIFPLALQKLIFLATLQKVPCCNKTQETLFQVG
jgi:hypothetical protein